MQKAKLGNIVIGGVIAVQWLLWLLFTPDSTLETNYYMQIIGEVIASTVMVMFAITLVLSARPRALEPYFGGLDKMWKTHKDLNLMAFLLIILHFFTIPITPVIISGKNFGMAAFFGFIVLVLITLAPRAPFLSRFLNFNYSRWRIVHKLMGVFYILGLVHFLTVETLASGSAPGAYMMIWSFIGIGAFLYRQFLAGRFEPYRPHEVAEVNRLNGKTVEVVLQPTDTPIDYRAGQFAYVTFSPGSDLREPHPFTISSAPHEDRVRFTIKNSGDWTSHLYDTLAPGRKAAVLGGFGRFDYTSGGPEQIWIAGGIGITPFLSWIRASGIESAHTVALFYSARNPTEAVFQDEIETAAASRDWLSAHVRYSSEDGSFRTHHIVELSEGDISVKDIYLCGPPRMTEAFSKSFRQLGVPRANIHYEEFNFR